ncbi:MAG: hypothetical protein U0350_51465 [Caldilineaceae bacterium]
MHGRTAQRRRMACAGAGVSSEYPGRRITKANGRELFECALSRSHTLTPARQGFNNIFPTGDELREIVKDPIAYQYEHLDGLKSTMILLNGLVQILTLPPIWTIK